jgi:hypothetical protein
MIDISPFDRSYAYDSYLRNELQIWVMLNGVPGAMVKDTKTEIKVKNFNRKVSFLVLQCIECTISKNIFY